MSIDFDSAAIQTQHDEEEYNQEDYAREQELHKLLTDLPDDMLEDSMDSSPELEYSTCSNKNTGKSSQPTWTQQCEWTDQPRPTTHGENYEVNYDQGSDHREYAYGDGAAQINGHGGQPLPHTWNQQSQSYQFCQGDYSYTSVGTEKSTEANDFSKDEYEPKPYPHAADNLVEYDREGGQRDKQTNPRMHFQVGYNPHPPACPPKMFSSQAPHQEGHFDHLQRELLDSVQNTAESEQLAQTQILNKAQQRQIEDLERKLEDSRRNLRYIEHQFAIVKDGKDGLAVSLKESSRLVEEAKEREVQMQNKVNSLEQTVQALNERDRENTNKQRAAEAAVESMKQQVVELCRSDTLSRAREQHDRDLTVMKEQHEDALLALQQQLDSGAQALKEQTDVGQRLREQVKQLERQREEEQVERAGIINALTQRLEESQQQCAKLLQTGSVQEMSQMQIKLQQAQSAKALSENMNKALQEDLEDLKEQITLYESAVKHGVIALDLNGDWENQMSESYIDLGLKKANRRNGRLHSTAVADLSDAKLPKDEALRELRAEMQRCLSSLKGKRQRISLLQEGLQHSQARVDELQTKLDDAQLSSLVRGSSQVSPLNMTGASQKELMRLQKDKQHFQEHAEALEKKNKELRKNEEKLRSANSELCTKMREMIQELDQEKQEAAERYERVQQQYRDDVVSRVRAELTLEHKAQVDQLSAQYQQQIQQLQTQLSEANDKMIAVQECYISVCKEKDTLEEGIRGKERDEASMRENESSEVVEKLRTKLEAQHQTSVNQLKALWSKEKETEVQQQVASARAAWTEELQRMEKTWAERLEDAGRHRHTETAEQTCQTEETEVSSGTVTVEELDVRLSDQKQWLQLEADKVKRKAVEEARKRAQRELHQKHLEDMAQQVEGAVTRAYNRWCEDLTSLPEYKAALQREKEKWEELQERHVQQEVSQALRGAEVQWQERHRSQLEEQESGAQRAGELQEEVTTLQSQLEQVRGEQAALLKAELAAARAAWNRDKQQEISSIQVRSEQQYSAKLQEQHRKLEQAREEAGLQKKKLLLQMEAELQQALRAKEEEWRGQQTEKAQALRRQIREEFLVELRTALAELQKQLLSDTNATQQQNTEETSASGTASESTTHIIQSSCKDVITTAVSRAKKEWKRISEERLSRVLKETQEHHEREINTIQNSHRREQASCGKQCAETVGKLQKKKQDLQRHLEKACRQLQSTVREHQAAMQRLRDEHESTLRKAKEDYVLQLQEVKRDRESSGTSDHQQRLQLGLEEMKQQYTRAVEKIRGDMLRYLQESKERAAQMIRVEVQRERQDTASKMRRYYLTCLQELLEDGGQGTTGAEKLIMNAAGKLAAMATVLETPINRKSGKHRGLPSPSTAVPTAGGTPRTHSGFHKIQIPEIRSDEKTHRDKTDSDHHITTATRSKAAHQDTPTSEKESSEEAQATIQTQLFSYKSSQQTVSLRSKSREAYLQGMDSGKADDGRPFLIQEPPVRDESQSDWSVVSNCSATSFHVPTLSYLGRKVESVKPFSVCAASPNDPGEFGSVASDVSDTTVYNEIAKMLPHTKALTFPGAKMSPRMEPLPGSEGSTQHRVCSKTQFSELRQCPQDSGFGTPFAQ
ncbi:centrosomal protein of 152 kDa [Diretmus argenteus]